MYKRQVRAAGARFSITARTNPQITKAITAIPETAWTQIKYPQAVWDVQAGGWVSDAAVAEVPVFTAFTSRPKAQQVAARLIVRRVKRLNPAARAGQGELFDTYRYHAVFTDSTEPMLDAEAHHRDHAIVEQVIADLKNGPLAHLPPGSSPPTPPGPWPPPSRSTTPAPPPPSPVSAWPRRRPPPSADA